MPLQLFNYICFDVFVFLFAVVFFRSFCFNVFIRFLNNSSATVFAQSSQPCPRSSSAVFVSLFMYLYLYLYLCLYSMFAQCAQACPYSSCSCSGLKTTAVSVLQMYKISIVTIYKIHRKQYSSIYCDNDNCWWSQQSRADVQSSALCPDVPFRPMSFFSFSEQSESITALWTQRQQGFDKNWFASAIN